jgi:hypothetical protein
MAPSNTKAAHPERIARSNISERGSRRPPMTERELKELPLQPTQTTIWDAAPQGTATTGSGTGRMRCGSKKAGQMVRPSDIGIALRRTWIERMQRSKAKSQLAAQQEQTPLHRAARDRFYICGEPGPLVLVIM